MNAATGYLEDIPLVAANEHGNGGSIEIPDIQGQQTAFH